MRPGIPQGPRIPVPRGPRMTERRRPARPAMARPGVVIAIPAAFTTAGSRWIGGWLGLGLRLPRRRPRARGRTWLGGGGRSRTRRGRRSGMGPTLSAPPSPLSWRIPSPGRLPLVCRDSLIPAGLLGRIPGIGPSFRLRLRFRCGLGLDAGRYPINRLSQASHIRAKTDGILGCAILFGLIHAFFEGRTCRFVGDLAIRR